MNRAKKRLGLASVLRVREIGTRDVKPGLKASEIPRPFGCDGASSYSHVSQIVYCAPLLRERPLDIVPIEVPEARDAQDHLGDSSQFNLCKTLCECHCFYYITTTHP